MRTYDFLGITILLALSLSLAAGCSGPPVARELGRAEAALGTCESYRSGGARSCLSTADWQLWAKESCARRDGLGGRVQVGERCGPGLYHSASFTCCPALTLPPPSASDLPPPPSGSAEAPLPFPSASPSVLPLPSASPAGSGDIPPPPTATDIPPPPGG